MLNIKGASSLRPRKQGPVNKEQEFVPQHLHLQRKLLVQYRKPPNLPQQEDEIQHHPLSYTSQLLQMIIDHQNMPIFSSLDDIVALSLNLAMFLSIWWCWWSLILISFSFVILVLRSICVHVMTSNATLCHWRAIYWIISLVIEWRWHCMFTIVLHNTLEHVERRNDPFSDCREGVLKFLKSVDICKWMQVNRKNLIWCQTKIIETTMYRIKFYA